MVVSSAVKLMFKETAMFTSLPRKGHGNKGKQSKSWSKSAGTGKNKKGEGDGKPNGKSTRSKSATCSYKGKSSKTVLSGLENRKSETRSETQESAQTYHTDNSYTDNSWFFDGWSFVAWNDDLRSVDGVKVWDQTYDYSASSFSLGHFSIELRSRWSRRLKFSSNGQWWVYP